MGIILHPGVFRILVLEWPKGKSVKCIFEISVQDEVRFTVATTGTPRGFRTVEINAPRWERSGIMKRITAIATACVLKILATKGRIRLSWHRPAVAWPDARSNKMCS